MRKKPLYLLALLVPLFVSLAIAEEEEGCQDTDTIGRCWDTYFVKQGLKVFNATTKESNTSPSNTVPAPDVQLLAEAKALLAKNTSASSPGAVVASATKDFLPLLRFFVNNATTSEDNRTITLDLRLPYLNAQQYSALKLQGVIREPVLFEPLRQALPEATRDDRASALEKEFSDLDDVTLVAAWNKQNKYLGRSRRSHMDLFSRAFEEIQDASEDPGAGALFELLMKLHEVSTQFKEDENLDEVTFMAIKPAALREEVRATVKRVAMREAEVEKALIEHTKDAGLLRMADLVDNQPQLIFSASYRNRKDLAGPDEFEAEATYELGFVNMNGLRKQCAALPKGRFLTCFDDYMLSPSNRAALERGDRLSFSAKYSQTRPYDAVLADDGVTFHQDLRRAIVGSLTYGRYLAFDENGKAQSRIDLSAQYENFRNDPERQDRTVATLTFSQRLTDSLFLPLTISYANNPEFLGDVDKRVSAHVGLTFKIDDGKGEGGGGKKK